MQCCGNVGPSEYAGDIPPSCSSYVIGCNQAFYDFYWRNTLVIALVGLVFGIFQIFGIAIAAYFAKEIRNAKMFIKAISQLDQENKKLLR